ncbi:MAG: copper resistance system multicopper oxidase, partial [Hyphomonadaceae bacterium]
MTISRRGVFERAGVLGAGLTLAHALPAWAQSGSAGLQRTQPALSGENIALTVARASLRVNRRRASAITVNGVLPAPLIRLREGQHVRLAVSNHLDEETSVHWHGLLVPHQFDGVPGLSFPGIRAGETFVYEFPVKQSGTYWYHSHSGLQEQAGHYGPIIIDPEGPDPIPFDREHVVVLSDFTHLSPHDIFRRLKQEPGVFNFQRETAAGLLEGRGQDLQERIEWARMRMDPADISDVTGAVYTYLINGHGPLDNWTAVFQPGERVRLRFINASAMTIFNVRIPGLALEIVQADGQNVKPVPVEEFQISVAETFDVIVTPNEDRAYPLVAEAVDRSGMGCAVLAPREGMSAPPPPLRPRPLATMRDMGMDMSAMEMSAAAMAWPGASAAAAPAMDMSGMDMSMRNPANAPQVVMGPGVQMISPMPVDRLGDRGQGLEDVGHRVLVYTDLEALE